MAEALSTERMRFQSVGLHIAGLSLLFLAGGMSVCALVDLVDRGDAIVPLAVSAALVASVGLLAWRATSVPTTLSAGAVFGSVFFAWMMMSVAGALPYLFSGTFETVDSALFESVSGFSCSGSTLLAEPESIDRGVLFWRQMTQWFGGMGVIVLAVAVLPFLGVGGLELISAEAPGPTSDRLAPRVSETAKRLWLVYLGFTVVMAVVLLVAGLSPFDAVAYSFTTVSTGGLAPHSASVGEFDSVTIEVIFQIGMLIGAMNFTLHWLALRGRPSAYWRNGEWRMFIGLTALAVVVVTAINTDELASVGESLRDSSFNVVSLATSTGFGNASASNIGGDFVLWASSAQLVLLFLMLIGAMTGSTSGGMKILRLQVMARFARRELTRARRPRVVEPIRTGSTPVPEDVVARIVGFVLLYLLLAGIGTLLVAALGADVVTAGSGVVSAIGNMGPALGDAGPTSTFLVFTRPARAVIMALMLIGRLELYAVILAVVAAPRVLRPALVSAPRRARGARAVPLKDAGSGISAGTR
jgi:trk system potassium uptake protein TrkH